MAKLASIATFVLCVCTVTIMACNKASDITSAAASNLPPAAGRDVAYSADVQPILQKYCQKCHLGNAHKGGFSLTSRDSALESGEKGPRIVPGDSAGSRLISHVAGAPGFKTMPPREPHLTPDEIGILRAWIDKGAKFE